MLQQVVAKARQGEGQFFKLLVIVLGLYFVAYSQWIGLLVLISAWGVDFLIWSVKIDALGSFVKIFIIVQGLSIWYMSSANVIKLTIFNSDASYMMFQQHRKVIYDNEVYIFLDSAPYFV